MHDTATNISREEFYRKWINPYTIDDNRSDMPKKDESQSMTARKKIQHSEQTDDFSI